MSKIDLRNFVDINIIYHNLALVSSTRDTVVLFSNEEGIDSSLDEVFSSMKEVSAAVAEECVNTLAYAETFFANAGLKLHIKAISVEETQTLASVLVDEIKELPDEQIVVAAVADYATMKSVATTREADTTAYGIKQKIILARTTSDNTDVVKNFGVKVSNVTGGEMTIAAYLSGIDVYRFDAIKDYCFTPEVIEAEQESNELVQSCINHNMNVDMYLAGAVRNIGGNMKDGYAVTNAFCLIVLHQTATERLLALLVQKISGSKGVASIGTTLSQELARYVTSGYLSTDKVWTKEPLTVMYNNKSYTIISTGEQLQLGYKVVVLPYEDLSDDDKASHKTPPIYIVIGDAYGIRKVTINGEVI